MSAPRRTKLFLRSIYYIVCALVFRSLVWVARKIFRQKVILFCRPAGIGDIISSFPAVLALRELHPDAILIYAVHAHFREVVEAGHVADYIIGCEEDPHFPKLVKEDFDDYFLPRLADESGRPQDSIHLVDDYCKLLGVTPQSRQPRLYTRGDVRDKAQEAVREFRAKSRYLIGIHRGPTWPVREWNDEAWSRLVELLIQKFNVTVLQLGTDASRATRIKGAVDWIGRFDLNEFMVVIEQLDLFIGIDSGPLHMAGALGRPSVGIFGAVDPKRRMGSESPSIAITSDAPCLGCHHRIPRVHSETSCPNDIICMKRIEPEAVFDAATKLLIGAGSV